MPRRSLVFVHAHPDDEALLTAGTMAKAVQAGHRVTLVVATDGAAGLADAAIAGELSQIRRAELEQSARALGIDDVVCLGYADSGLHGQIPEGFAHVASFSVARRIADVCNDVSADVLVGYDPAGGYGHPDHLKVHRCVRTSLALCTRTPSLFEATLPREPIAGAVRLAQRLRLTPAGFDAAEFSQAWTPRREITHRVNVRPYLEAKDAALRAHASQASADGTVRTLAVLTRLPRAVQAPLLGTEYYVSVPWSPRIAKSTASGAS